ncbi:MAG: MerR family transcriptional regulator [Gammaproteobacteria bacterium]|nr:MerR family transcriptional regulator [Gammaproteobacteria bacterium]
MSTKPESGLDDLYPIRTVVSLTGINAVTLRAWERRYGLVKPKRTAKGHRLYTRKNIEIINRAIELQEQGIPISQAAEVLKRRLQAGQTVGRVTDEVWRRHQDEMLDAVTVFSEARLDAIYEEVLATHSVQAVIRKLIIPLLEEIGLRWSKADGSVAEEHFFAVYMRNKLGAMFHHRTRLTQGDRLLSACMPGELHEVGLLIFSLCAHEAGFRPVLLGADMPLNGLPLAAVRAGCKAIVLSARRTPSMRVMEVDLPALVRNSNVPVFVGGAAAADINNAVVRAKANPLGKNIDAGLRRLTEHLDKMQTAEA